LADLSINIQINVRKQTHRYGDQCLFFSEKNQKYRLQAQRLKCMVRQSDKPFELQAIICTHAPY
jgi:hypothetical protein